jgi:hypothetical protein
VPGPPSSRQAPGSLRALSRSPLNRGRLPATPGTRAVLRDRAVPARHTAARATAARRRPVAAATVAASQDRDTADRRTAIKTTAATRAATRLGVARRPVTPRLIPRTSRAQAAKGLAPATARALGSQGDSAKAEERPTAIRPPAQGSLDLSPRVQGFLVSPRVSAHRSQGRQAARRRLATRDRGPAVTLGSRHSSASQASALASSRRRHQARRGTALKTATARKAGSAGRRAGSVRWTAQAHEAARSL